jgi:hypothetical protein
MSETLREEEGDHEVAEDENAEDQADEVLAADVVAHSRSVPFRISRMSRKIAAVIAR